MSTLLAVSWKSGENKPFSIDCSKSSFFALKARFSVERTTGCAPKTILTTNDAFKLIRRETPIDEREANRKIFSGWM